MATVFLTIRGDQLGTFDTMSGTGNGTARVVTLTNTQAVGTGDDTYTIRVDQVEPAAAEFTNGQFVTILDASGAVLMQTTTPQHDIEQGLGAGDEHLIFASTRYFIDLTGVTPGTTTLTAADNTAHPDRGDNDGELDFADTRRDFPCFATGTLIATPCGPKPVQTLAAGDRVSDLAGHVHAILWTAERRIRLDRPDHPQRPIRFRPGSLPVGRGGPQPDRELPDRDLLVSPQHRMLVVSPAGTQMLAAAHALTGRRGVRCAYGLRSVTYHALLLPRHAVLMANGAGAESFYPGPHILLQLPAFQRLQVLAHVPALLTDPHGGYGPAARPVLTPAAARGLHRMVGHAI